MLVSKISPLIHIFIEGKVFDLERLNNVDLNILYVCRLNRPINRLCEFTINGCHISNNKSKTLNDIKKQKHFMWIFSVLILYVCIICLWKIIMITFESALSSILVRRKNEDSCKSLLSNRNKIRFLCYWFCLYSVLIDRTKTRREC